MENSPRKTAPSGFALVVTLSLMILLTVIAVGLLTLSSISLRASSQSLDLAIARANARVALMLAVGELQKTAGLDTRVTARADLVDPKNPPVLGVWKSWEGTDHESSGRPIAPTYMGHKKARFLAWLTSETLAAKCEDPLTMTAATGKVTLLGEKSVGIADAAQRQIYLTPTKITLAKSSGSYAWWVCGENQKARLPRPYAPSTGDPATWSVLVKTHASVDPAPFGLDKLLNDPSLKDPSMMSVGGKAITIKQGDLLAATVTSGPKLSQEYFHDLSVNSVGLLTNTATGGWRKDLSLVTENWNSLPAANLPFFRVTPTADLLFTRPETDPINAGSILYRWTSYRRNATANKPIYSFPAICSWANLANYATLYKNVNATSPTSSMTVNAQAAAINGDIYNYIHKVRILPVIARVQWIYSHKTVSSSTLPGKYDLNLLVTPVFTLWNPYNVSIASIPDLTFSLQGTLPPLIDYKIGGAALADSKLITLQTDKMAGDSTMMKGLTGITNYTLTGIAAFGPGETRVFSPNGASNTLVAGYTLGGGVSYPVQAASAMGAAQTGSSKISTSVTFDSEFNDAGAIGVGLYLNMNSAGSGSVAAGTVLAYRMSYPKSTVSQVYPPLAQGKLPQPSLAEAAVAAPFLSITFGARMASNTHLPSKGFVQSSPFVNYTAMGLKGSKEPTIQYTYPGTQHNVNSPFEYSFQALKVNSPFLPEAADTRGFIMTGFKASNGLSRCVIDELPGRPLSSLAELQNWDARYENPVPPYAFNLVANSDATPLLPSNSIVNTADASAKGDENLQHDDSYCLNHVLFDDWFFSSIAPEPAGFGSPAAASSAQSICVNLLTDLGKPLANRSYKALPRDVAFASVSLTNANTLAANNVGVADTSYKTIASRLEVEGMFNVNSTSVKAWRALLGHARNQRIPYIGSSGNPQLSAESDYAVSRFTVAGDVESSKNGVSGEGAGAAEYAGYRLYSEAGLDFLAVEIVNQVRLRGPFLSLSEFVNRQLSSDKNLALAGAIQTALNKLAEDSALNPFKVLQKDTTPEPVAGSPASNIATENPTGGVSGYKFSAAAVGYNLYGVPGWTRQADILRPLAPILTARDDTFTIRAYGDSRDATGLVIKARAVCEATIRRGREYVDPADDAATSDLSPSSGIVPTKKPLNALFGRRFEIVSFRWLSQDEI